MLFSNDILTQIIILVLGIAGFMVAKHIRNHKVKNMPLICPIGFDCHAVVHSDYSRFFGVPVEIFGMIYYAFISVFYLGSIFLGQILPNIFLGLTALVSLLALLFSAYLIGVQIFILKKGCSWCIVSAIICFLIFILIIWR
ncbi:vitamin K epoxide reductase family protein [Candidatus Nomurabacteria bacterium]|nr:vitamin K epoxide reductase family protein [Candidatus Nomurabacteria bacterium]